MHVETRRELADAAAALLEGIAIDAAPVVDLLEDEILEIEVATTLLYGACHYPYRQIRDHVAALGQPRRAEIVSLGASTAAGTTNCSASSPPAMRCALTS